MTEKTSEVAEARAENLKDGPPDQNQDDSMQIFASSGEMFEYSAKEERMVRWKLDLILLPMVCLKGVDIGCGASLRTNQPLCRWLLHIFFPSWTKWLWENLRFLESWTAMCVLKSISLAAISQTDNDLLGGTALERATIQLGQFNFLFRIPLCAVSKLDSDAKAANWQILWSYDPLVGSRYYMHSGNRLLRRLVRVSVLLGRL